MVVDDIAQFGKDETKRGPIVGVLEVTIEGVKEPEAGIGGMIEPFVLAFGKEIGDEAVADGVSKGAQDPAGFSITASDQGESFEADHGIPAPVGKPMIPCNHGTNFI